jgi:hypothetical protein
MEYCGHNGMLILQWLNSMGGPENGSTRPHHDVTLDKPPSSSRLNQPDALIQSNSRGALDALKSPWGPKIFQ